MEVRIGTLTPIWTGDVDQKSELLQSTSIAGSLRWWAEAILRSIDGIYACDPTSDERCPKEERNKKYYCSACLIFGATGIRKTFRLNVNGGEGIFPGGILNIKPSGRDRGWYLKSGLVGEINLEITPLDRDFDGSLVLLPIIIASKWGGIGAKTQHGYGVVKIEDCPKIDFNRFKEAIKKITAQERLSKLSELSRLKIKLRHGTNNGLPNLREMFFAKVQFEAKNGDWWKGVDGLTTYVNNPRMENWVNSGSVPIAPALKNWLRYGNGARLWKTTNQNQNRRIENWLFGTIKYDKIASKLNVSCAYPVSDNLWEFRIWGWILKDGSPAGFDRDGFLDKLNQALNDSGSVKIPWNKLLGDQTRNHKLKVWREFDSSRDTVRPNESDINNYLQSLLEDE